MSRLNPSDWRKHQKKDPVKEDLPSIELLESTHQFPCPYMFKVIGAVDRGFVARVVASVRDELGESIDPPYSMRTTSGGRHVAVTLEPTIQTAQQVLAVYRRLQATAGLRFLW